MDGCGLSCYIVIDAYGLFRVTHSHVSAPLRSVLDMCHWRFNELKKSLEGISQKVLTDSLRSIEEDGLITRTVYPEVPPRVEYALSDLGETMRPILDAMQEWGTTYKNGTI